MLANGGKLAFKANGLASRNGFSWCSLRTRDIRTPMPLEAKKAGPGAAASWLACQIRDMYL